MKNYILIISLIVALCIVGYLGDKKSKSDETVAKVVTASIDEPYVLNNNWYYRLSDAQILDAIKAGYSYDKEGIGKFERSYSLPQKSENLVILKGDSPEAFLRTPYFEVVEKASRASEGLGTISLDSAKSFVSNGTVGVTIFLYNDRSIFPKNFNAVLKQDGVTIQPVSKKMKGVDDQPLKIRSNINGNERYLLEVSNAYYVGDKFDLRNPVELLILFNGEQDSISYNIDFKKYR